MIFITGIKDSIKFHTKRRNYKPKSIVAERKQLQNYDQSMYFTSKQAVTFCIAKTEFLEIVVPQVYVHQPGWLK